MKISLFHKQDSNQNSFIQRINIGSLLDFTFAPMVTKFFKLFCMIFGYLFEHTHKQCPRKKTKKNESWMLQLFYRQSIGKCSPCRKAIFRRLRESTHEIHQIIICLTRIRWRFAWVYAYWVFCIRVDAWQLANSVFVSNDKRMSSNHIWLWANIDITIWCPLFFVFIWCTWAE